MKKLLLQTLLFSGLILTGCGYKPSSAYQDRLIGENIKVNVDITAKNPREGVFLEDAVRDAVYSVFHKNLCFQNCDTILTIDSANNNLEAIDFDENGYPILYRSKVTLKVTLKDKTGKTRHYSVEGSYDFNVASQGVVTDQMKLQAYKRASINALNKLIANITKDGAENDN
ncbi:MAG: hypothetical protein GXO62_08775 [Epsilonproteobacteria bacterium]|nr:hypothetical protein [Campylobacterota bacterium]